MQPNGVVYTIVPPARTAVLVVNNINVNFLYLVRRLGYDRNGRG